MSATHAIWMVPLALLAGGAGLVVGIRYREQVIRGLGGQPSPTVAVAGAPSSQPATSRAPEGADIVKYTCGMHPQIIMNGPGNCPICNMPLVAIHLHTGVGVTIDPVMVQNMGVRTAMPVLGKLSQDIRAVGTLTEPEQNHREINLRVNGWIQKLYANQDGMAVDQGDPLFELYSPEITAAADELINARKLLEASRGRGDSSTVMNGVVVAGRRKLELLGLPAEQVAAIENMDKAPATVTIVSPMHGHIAEKKIIEGSAVMAGSELMKIADRSTMWMIVQVFEQQLGQVKVGAKVEATVTATPGEEYTGKVDFVYPHLDPATRTAQVRVVIDNASHRLHENMFAQAVIEGVPGERPLLLVPREAVMDSGVRQIVFLDLGNGHFAAREVKVGRSGTLRGNWGGAEEGSKTTYTEVLAGLTENDTVVTSGQFLLDSESRLEEARKKFAMPEQAADPAPGDAMPGMDMGGDK